MASKSNGSCVVYEKLFAVYFKNLKEHVTAHFKNLREHVATQDGQNAGCAMLMLKQVVHISTMCALKS